jgi:hypothetical protein
MSERSFRRENQRRIAAAKRREANRAKRAAVTAAAVGAFVLGAPAVSSAATFTVNTDAAGGTTCDPTDATVPCSLPDAVSQANTNAEDDTILFDSALSGSTITLNDGTYSGPIAVNTPNAMNIDTQGSDITVDGNDLSYVFDIQDTGNPAYGLAISGLTLTGGYGGFAGAVLAHRNTFSTLDNVTITGSTSTGAYYNSGPPFFSFYGAGGGVTNAGQMTISNSEISGNHSNAYDGPYGGGGGIDNAGVLTVSNSKISGNYAFEGGGGGVFVGASKYPASTMISNSEISGNYAGFGGGVWDFGITKYGAAHNQISDTTISGNGSYAGGGFGSKYMGGSDNWTITHSTLASNSAGDGGGIVLGQSGGPSGIAGHFNLVDSTISGNNADIGGGVYLGAGAQKYEGSVQFNNSTVASNYAPGFGGGFAVASFDGYYTSAAPIPVNSTIIGQNVTDGAQLDLDSEDSGSSGSALDASFSLVQNPGNLPVNSIPPGSVLFGVSPQLGGLTNNGGPTETQLPAISSPAVDKGNAPPSLTTDQRGLPRTVDTGASNANDGTDIGAVELTTGPPFPPGATKVHGVKKKHKKRRRIIRTKHKFAKIHLTFSSATPGASFTCSIDGSPFEPCTSPFRARVSSAPGHGKKHTIVIQLVDSNGNPVGKPRVFKFRVILKD